MFTLKKSSRFACLLMEKLGQFSVFACGNQAIGFSVNGSSTSNGLFQTINGLLETAPSTITSFHLKIENLELFVNY